MAEPIFDEHPLEEYFRRAGESSQLVPGGSPEFAADPDDSTRPCIELEQLPSFVLRTFEFLGSLYPSRPSSEDTFAERFKYDVISSSLLSTTLAAPRSSTRPSFSPELPGNLLADTEDSSQASQQASSAPSIQWPLVLFSIATAALAAEYYFIAIFLIGGATYLWHVIKTTRERAGTMSATLQAVDELISAGNVWDSAVNEAINIIEKEEKNIFYGSSNPSSPSSSLRVALQSSLHTTQTQCDNVRQLLSALTEPVQLQQMSEMYAPSSPLAPTFSQLDHPRPFSVPIGRRQRTTSTPADKRATWNGTYASLAIAGSPLAHVTKRRDKRRSDMTTLFASSPSKRSSTSAPTSPRLEGVLEEDDDDDDDDDNDGEPSVPDGEYFGVEALGLHRKRRSAALDILRSPPPSYSQASRSHSHRSGTSSVSFSPSTPTFAASSRLTPVHTTRHPLSLSGLQLALHGALSSKRWACSHLLALRFEEDEDDAYWEDVRSMMALLMSTFQDASSRLREALDEAEKQRVRDERPSPKLPEVHHQARTMAEMVSFAPMPSHLTRFAAHVDAISSALNDAREHLEQCVTSLKDDTQCVPINDASAVQEHSAFQAYDRLRKELGYALRECERGRERLLDVVSGPRSSAATEDLINEPDDTPGLGQDSGSDSSEKSSPAPQLFDISISVSGEQPTVGTVHEEDLDDATSHLLLTATTQHLPAPGVEQVFEADTSAAVSFTRERSKLSREERIKLAKARRESAKLGLGISSSADATVGRRSSGQYGENWGPGGEVVQELKDVIWKVGERRRKLAEQSHPALAPAFSTTAPEEQQQKQTHIRAPVARFDDTTRTERFQDPFLETS